MASISRITPELYVGTIAVARDAELLSSLGITHICSCIGGEALFSERFEYLVLNFNDRPSVNLVTPSQALNAFFPPSDVGNDDVKEPAEKEVTRKLLVYCGAGMSRSPALAIAWLMHEKGMTFQNAADCMKKGRGKLVRINDGFLKQLQEMEPEKPVPESST